MSALCMNLVRYMFQDRCMPSRYMFRPQYMLCLLLHILRRYMLSLVRYIILAQDTTAVIITGTKIAGIATSSACRKVNKCSHCLFTPPWDKLSLRTQSAVFSSPAPGFPEARHGQHRSGCPPEITFETMNFPSISEPSFWEII